MRIELRLWLFSEKFERALSEFKEIRAQKKGK